MFPPFALAQSSLSVGELLSNDGSAGYIGDPALLVDGRPGTTAMFFWPEVGGTLSYVTMPYRIQPTPVTGKVPKLFCVLNMDSQIPVGTSLTLLGGTTSDPSTVLASTAVRQFSDGTRGVWVYLPANTNLYDWYGWRINNTANAIAPGAIISIGEIYADAVDAWPIQKFQKLPMDPTKNNRASGQQPWPAMRAPYFRASLTIAPQTFPLAFLQAGHNLEALCMRLARAKYFAVCLYPSEPDSDTVNDDYVNATSLLCRAVDFSGMDATAESPAWPLSITLEEVK